MTLTDGELLVTHARYVAALRDHGVDDADILRMLRHQEREDAEIAAGRCPKCGAPLRVHDGGGRLCSWQRPTERGRWVMYRCSTRAPLGRQNPPGACDFMVDRFERDGAN